LAIASRTSFSGSGRFVIMVIAAIEVENGS
jgi:hypothetical protein